MSTRNIRGLDDTTLGGRIFLCRLALGLVGVGAGRTTQSDLADSVNKVLLDQGFNFPAFSKVTVSRWEAGKTEPSLATIAALAAVFRCDPGWLAFGAGEGRESPLPGWVNKVHPSALAVMSLAQETRPEEWTATPEPAKPLPRKRR
jgi:transcriptional regulator with XRE-family HTH domain